MTLQDLWWLNYLMPLLLLLIALLLSVWGIVIHIRSKNRQRKHEQLSAMYYKKYLARRARKNHVG